MGLPSLFDAIKKRRKMPTKRAHPLTPIGAGQELLHENERQSTADGLASESSIYLTVRTGRAAILAGHKKREKDNAETREPELHR